MTKLRRRFLDDMTLYGLALTTQKVYLNAVEQLAAHFQRSPQRETQWVPDERDVLRTVLS